MATACVTATVETAMPTIEPNQGRSWSSRIGRMMMKAAPKNAPMIEPSPPMMTRNSNWNERSTENACDSHEPR